MEYFLRLETQNSSPLILWGAASKGKAIAKILIASSVSFCWICNNKNKHGHDIYGVLLEDSNAYAFSNKAKVIVAVAQKNAQIEIVKTLESNNLKAGTGYFLFC